METQTAQLSLEDISLIVNVLSVCSKRGAFSPEEFTVLGALFTKLVSFLPQQEEAESDETQEEETAEAVNSGETNTIAVDFTSAKA